jgi:hypothetical protein
LPQPYNYNIQSPDIMGNMLGGLQTGLTIQGMAQAQKQKVLTAQRDETMRADLATLGQNPSVNAIQSAILKYPELENHFKPIIENMSAREKDEAISVGSRVYAAVHNKDFSSADKILDLQIEAYKNNGREAESQSMVQIKDLLAKNPSTAMTTIGLFLASSMGREKFAENFERLEKLDSSINKTQAETNKLVGDETRASDSAGTELDIQKESLRKIKAEADSLANQDGTLPNEKKPEFAMKLRKEYADQTQVFKGTKDAYARIQAADPSAAGDLSLIFSYMKMLDPGSTVREGEFANAQNAGGVNDKISNIYNKLISGERLTEGQRKSFKGQSKGLYETAKKEEAIVRKGLQGVGKRLGINSEDIFYEETITDPDNKLTPPPGSKVRKFNPATGKVE